MHFFLDVKIEQEQMATALLNPFHPTWPFLAPKLIILIILSMYF